MKALMPILKIAVFGICVSLSSCGVKAGNPHPDSNPPSAVTEDSWIGIYLNPTGVAGFDELELNMVGVQLIPQNKEDSILNLSVEEKILVSSENTGDLNQIFYQSGDLINTPLLGSYSPTRILVRSQVVVSLFQLFSKMKRSDRYQSSGGN